MPTNEQVTKTRMQEAIALMKQRRYDPLKELIEIAQTAEDPELRYDIAKALMPYVYPKLKHVEVDAHVQNDIVVNIRQFVVPTVEQKNIVEVEAEDNESIKGQGQPIGVPKAKPEQRPGGGEILERTREAALAGGMAGHPDILPDPRIPSNIRKIQR